MLVPAARVYPARAEPEATRSYLGIAGERDPQKLAGVRDRRIKASETTIAKALVGDYRAEHLFTLRQAPRALPPI